MGNSLSIITGASSGIRFEVPRQIGFHGYDLFIVSNSDEIFKAQDELEEDGFDVDALKTNLATYSGVENLIEQIFHTRKHLTAVAINASVGDGGPFLEINLKEEINLLKLDVLSIANLTKRILPIMSVQQEGRILNQQSISFSSSTKGKWTEEVQESERST